MAELGLEGPRTTGVNELAVVEESAGLTTRGVTVPGLVGLMYLGEGIPALTLDCSVEGLMGVLGRGLCITGGEES